MRTLWSRYTFGSHSLPWLQGLAYEGPSPITSGIHSSRTPALASIAAQGGKPPPDSPTQRPPYHSHALLLPFSPLGTVVKPR